MADGSNFTISHVSPVGSSTFGETTITLRGSGLSQLRQAIFRPRFMSLLVEVRSDAEVTVQMNCRLLQAGLHTLNFQIIGRTTEYPGSGGTGLRLVCFNEPRFDGLRPVLGPSHPGMLITLTSTLTVCTRPEAEQHLCMPPALDIMDRMNLLASSTVISWARTRDVARCRYVCDFLLGCNDRPIDVTGPVGNVTRERVQCYLPPEIHSHSGRVEIQLTLEGTHFTRPDNQVMSFDDP